jgi:hypothetical protein
MRRGVADRMQDAFRIVNLAADQAHFDQYLELYNRTLESFRSFGDR